MRVYGSWANQVTVEFWDSHPSQSSEYRGWLDANLVAVIKGLTEVDNSFSREEPIEDPVDDLAEVPEDEFFMGLTKALVGDVAPSASTSEVAS